MTKRIVPLGLILVLGLTACVTNPLQQKLPEGNASIPSEPSKAQQAPQDDSLNQLRQRAENGDAESQYALGLRYAKGKGVPQNYAQAFFWFRKAAEQGHAGAQNNLGAMYQNGWGVPQDYAQAAFWYRKAAEQGYAVAQNNLGVLYANGQGVPRSNVIAYALYNLAAANDPRNQTAVNNRQKISKRMTPQEIQEGQQLTQKLMERGNFLKALDEATRKAGGPNRK